MDIEIEKLNRIRRGEWQPNEYKGLYELLSPSKEYLAVSTGHSYISSIKRVKCLICVVLNQEQDNLSIGLIFETSYNKNNFEKLLTPGRVFLLNNNYPTRYGECYIYFSINDDEFKINFFGNNDMDFNKKFEECRNYWIGSANSNNFKDQKDFVPISFMDIDDECF